jgi:hypothetical protein
MNTAYLKALVTSSLIGLFEDAGRSTQQTKAKTFQSCHNVITAAPCVDFADSLPCFFMFLIHYHATKAI